MRLARLTTKGDKGRTIWMPKRVLHEYVRPYIREDRDNSALRAAQDGAYEGIVDGTMVTSWRETVCTVRAQDGTLSKVQYEHLAPNERHRMFSQDGRGNITEPGMLWLTEDGRPTTLNNMEAVFSRACERCATFGIHISISPHVLRHTFAVYMLSHLIRGVVSGGATVTQTNGEGVYRRVISDPLRTLQKMLGHASITTTYKYLTYIEEAEEAIDEAVGAWGDRLGTPSDHMNVEEGE